MDRESWDAGLAVEGEMLDVAFKQLAVDGGEVSSSAWELMVHRSRVVDTGDDVGGLEGGGGVRGEVRVVEEVGGSVVEVVGGNELDAGVVRGEKPQMVSDGNGPAKESDVVELQNSHSDLRSGEKALEISIQKEARMPLDKDDQVQRSDAAAEWSGLQSNTSGEGKALDEVKTKDNDRVLDEEERLETTEQNEPHDHLGDGENSSDKLETKEIQKTLDQGDEKLGAAGQDKSCSDSSREEKSSDIFQTKDAQITLDENEERLETTAQNESHNDTTSGETLGNVDQNESSNAAIDEISQPFQYRKLEEGHFRLLELHPGTGNDPLICSLGHLALGRQKFTAVSYCWGSPDRIHELQCGWVTQDSEMRGRVALKPCGTLKITTNLRSCLLSVRNEEFYTSLWVDSICINQEDLDEKGVQVKMMHAIYGNATSTVIYLGSADDTTELAFTCADILASETLPNKEMISFLDTGNVRDFHPTVVVEVDEDKPAFWYFWDPFTKLLGREWFKRIWVLQEIILSRFCIVMCGEYRMLWTGLFKACQTVERLGVYPQDDRRERCKTVLSMEVRREGYQEYRKQLRESRLDSMAMAPFLKSMELSMLQYWTRNRGATDPRDKVFALLNLNSAGAYDGDIPVDYRMSVAEVYAWSARHWFYSKPSNSLDFLGFVDNSIDNGDLPSWIPDWRNPWNTRPFTTLSIEGAARKPRLVFHEFPEIPTPFSLPLQLKVRGIPLMVIKDIEKIKMPDETWRTGRHSEILNHYKGPYPTTTLSYIDAFIRSVNPSVPSDFDRVANRFVSYWRYETARMNRKAFRKIRLTNGETREGEMYIDVAERRDAERSRVPYTQELVYSLLPPHYRNHAFVTPEPLIAGREFFVSSNGFMGLVPQKARVGDQIVLLFNTNTPMVLRKMGDSWTFIGECFVYGIMSGEALEDFDFEIVETFCIQ